MDEKNDEKYSAGQEPSEKISSPRVSGLTWILGSALAGVMAVNGGLLSKISDLQDELDRRDARASRVPDVEIMQADERHEYKACTKDGALVRLYADTYIQAAWIKSHSPSKDEARGEAIKFHSHLPAEKFLREYFASRDSEYIQKNIPVVMLDLRNVFNGAQDMVHKQPLVSYVAPAMQGVEIQIEKSNGLTPNCVPY